MIFKSILKHKWIAIFFCPLDGFIRGSAALPTSDYERYHDSYVINDIYPPSDV